MFAVQMKKNTNIDNAMIQVEGNNPTDCEGFYVVF